MLNQGKIVRCSFEKFQSISHDPDILYVIKDKGQIWMDEETFSVINNLVSTSATDALSALQGKVLKDMIDELNSNMEAINLNNLV